MLDGRHDPALALLLADSEPGGPDMPRALAILPLAGTASLIALLVCLSLMIA